MGDQGTDGLTNQSTERYDSTARTSSVQPIQSDVTEQSACSKVTLNIDNNHNVSDIDAAGATESRDSIKGNDATDVRLETAQEQEPNTSFLPSDSYTVEPSNLPTCISPTFSSADNTESIQVDTSTHGSNTPSEISPNPVLTTSPGGSNTAGITLTPLSDGKPGQKGKTKRRGSAWTDDETDFLMEVWAKHSDAGGTEEFPHSTPVYRLISKAMAEKGFDKTWEQCKTRIHTVKRAYKITEDEIKAGKMNIIYCKHYEYLRIIMGNDPTTAPNVLSEHLAKKRQEREVAALSAQDGTLNALPQTTTPSSKRKLTSSEKSVKRQNSGNSDKSQISPSSFSPLADVSNQSTSTVVTSHVWVPGVNVQPTPITATLAAPQQTVFMPPAQYLIPPPPPYQPPAPSYPTSQLVIPQVPPHRPQLQEINNNNIAIKTERVEDQKVQFAPFAPPHLKTFHLQGTAKSSKTLNNNGNSAHVTKSNLHQKKEELEKLKLNLEMRKLDMERNKLEMEERQRREERDHQYRMMQLLLFGLGQQNAQNVTGHVAEQELGHVPNTITLSRAIENGLLPGGSLRANEKGLSFSEI